MIKEEDATHESSQTVSPQCEKGQETGESKMKKLRMGKVMKRCMKQ